MSRNTGSQIGRIKIDQNETEFQTGRINTGMFVCFTTDRVVSELFIEYAMGLFCGLRGKSGSIQHQNLLRSIVGAFHVILSEF